VALFVAVFQIAERIVGPPERSPGLPVAEASPQTGEPISIEIERLGPHSMRIEVGGIHASTVRLSSENDGDIDELIECVNQGIEQAKQAGEFTTRSPDNWWARQAERHLLGEQVSRIQHQCFSDRLVDLALPPLPPSRIEPASATGTP
jgi:hypothetical protein